MNILNMYQLSFNLNVFQHDQQTYSMNYSSTNLFGLTTTLPDLVVMNFD